MKPSPDEIREALDGNIWIDPGINVEYARTMSQRLGVLKEAARAYADLLENGQEKRAEQRELSVMPWVLIVPGPGRYLVVPVQEEE